MTTIVVGSHGMVGSALMQYLSDAVGTYNIHQISNPVERQYEYLDISNVPSVNDFFDKHKPNRVFIAAANPHVDGCENPDTDKVNINGVSAVVQNSLRHNAQVIFFSSSYVFDGESSHPYKVTDETNPVNRYGRQKEIIERILRSSDGQWVIIRTVGVFGEEGVPKNFVHQIRQAVLENRKIRVPVDQTMNPVNSMDLAKVSIHLSHRYSGQIFHVAGNRCISKYDFAIRVAFKLGHPKPHDLIVGMKSEDMKQFAVRPKNGCLDCGDLRMRAITVPHFERGLGKYLEQR